MSGSEGGRRKSAPNGVTRRRPTLLNQYVGKGQRVYVAGRLVQNSWETEDGQRRHRTEVYASEVVFLDGGNGNGGSNDGEEDSPF